MKGKFLGVARLALVTVSALAFMNCDDSVSSATDAINNLANSSSSVASENVMPESSAVAESATSDGELVTSSSSVTAGDASEVSEGTGVSSASENGEASAVESSASEAVVESSGDGAIEVSSSSVMESSDPEVASSSSEKSAVASSSSEEVAVQAAPSIFLSENGDENSDQLEVERMENVGPDGAGILAYPKTLSSDPNVKHAVVIWGPGGGTEPSAYNGMINRLASHGFVVFALSSSPGDASKAIAAIDWLEERNNLDYGVLSGKLDMTKVGCSGHSMGGLESEQALIKDKRVITAIMNNSGDLGHTAMASVGTDNTIAIVYGEGGMERPNAEADYGNSAVTAPACLIKMTGGTGTECQNGECGWGHGSGPWGGMAATVSWMRWHLGGEEERKADFVGTSGAYINGPIVGSQGSWYGQCKNF